MVQDLIGILSTITDHLELFKLRHHYKQDYTKLSTDKKNYSGQYQRIEDFTGPKRR